MRTERPAPVGSRQVPVPPDVLHFLAVNTEFLKLRSATGGPFARRDPRTACTPHGVFVDVSCTRFTSDFMHRDEEHIAAISACVHVV